MTVDVFDRRLAPGAARGDVVAGSGIRALRRIVVAAGIVTALLFVAVGLRSQLQMYADGSIFSYAVAVEDAWAFHWHNIASRLFVWLYAMVPAEAYIGLSGDPAGGVVLYGFLFFVAQALGLAATFAADRSSGRIIFHYACCSTAALCPLVFGFPTETWMAHALFWPALAICHHTRQGVRQSALIFAVLLALVFTHPGALIFVAAILVTLLLRRPRNPAFKRTGLAVLAAVPIWLGVKAAYPPDAYCASVLLQAALEVFSPSILTGDLIKLLAVALAGYGAVFVALRRLAPAHAHLVATAGAAAALALYWLRFDHALHAENRYYLRTVLLVVTPGLGAMAAAYALDADGRLDRRIPLLPRVMAALRSEMAVRAATGALLLILLIHAIETTKFVSAWTNYKAAVRTLATGTASDPALGDPQFVASQRIDASLNRLSWNSTTHFLSVLLAPDLRPARLVVDSSDWDYFWLSCETAKHTRDASRALPRESRRLVQVHACLHR
jgi:hypothetical protein